MRPLNSTYCALVLCLSGSIVFAQDEPDTAQIHQANPISTERPSFSSSPIALESGRWQFELGYQYSKDNEGVSVDDHTLPLLLIRTGIADRIELQISWPGYSWTDVNGNNGHGANDVGIGLKWQLSDPNAATLLGLFAGLTFPVGSSEIGADDTEPVLGLFWSHSGRFSLFGTVLLSKTGNDTVINNAIGFDFQLPVGSGAYVEYLITAQEGNGPEHSLGAGISFLRNNDLQFDVNAGIGLNDQATDFYIGASVARRF